MGRPKGSKNKKQTVACNPPPVKEEVVPETNCPKVIDPRVVLIEEPNTRYDGAYIVGKREDGKHYIGRVLYIDCLPQTKELLKRLGVE